MVSPSKKKSVRAKITNRSKKNAHLLGNQPLFQPLANQRFYLHLTGLKNLGEITADIKHLGGEVEEFLSKEVHYVIVPTKPTPSSGTSVSPSTGEAASPSAPPPAFSPCHPLPSLAPSPNPPAHAQFPNTPSPHGEGSPDNAARHTNSPTSAASLLSPLPPTAALSPYPPLDPTRRVTSRAAALLVRARFRQPGTSDVVSNARRWGAQVWSVAKLQNYLAELANHPNFKALGSSYSQKRSGTAAAVLTSANVVSASKPCISSSRLPHSNSHKVHASTKLEDKQLSSSKHTKTKKAFVKLEDFSKKYRPLFKEISNWPVLNVDTSRSTCPFAEALPRVWSDSSRPCTPRTKKQNCNGPDCPLTPNVPAAARQGDDIGSLATPNRAGAKGDFCSTPQAAARGASHSRRNSGGYCELCRVHYTSLRTHLLSTSHQSFVTNPSNYGELDRLISEVHDQQARAFLHERWGRPQNTRFLLWCCTNTPMRYTSITSTTNGPLHSSKSNTSSSGSTTTSTVPSQHLLDRLQVTTPPSATISPSALESSLAQSHHCGTFATASKIGKPCAVYKLGETVYSGPASGRRCGARPDDVATREAAAPGPSAETSHHNSSSNPASHHTLCALHLSVSTSTTPSLLPNSCLHASSPCSPNRSKVNRTLCTQELGELCTKNTASPRDCSTSRSFEASLRELNLTCSNRSISSSPPIKNTNIEEKFDSSSKNFKPVYSVVSTDKDVSFSLDQSTFGVKVIFNNNNTSNVFEVNGQISDAKERSRGIVAGCKAGPRSRVKRLSKTLNSSFDSGGESLNDSKDSTLCSDPSRVKSEDYSLVSNSISLSSSSVCNSVNENEPKSVVNVNADSVDKLYVQVTEPSLTAARSVVHSDSEEHGDAVSDVANSVVPSNIPPVAPDDDVGIISNFKNCSARISELKDSCSRRSSSSSGEVNTRASSPESVIALTEGDPLQLDVTEVSCESAVLTVSSIDSGVSVSDLNNPSATKNGSAVALANSALTPSDDESSNSEIVISCGSVIADSVPTHRQGSASANVLVATTVPSASSCTRSAIEKEKSSAVEITNSGECVQKKAVKSIVQVKQVSKPRRSPRTSPLGTPLSSPHNTPRNSPLPPVDTVEECDTDVSQSACGRLLRSRALSNVLQNEKLDTIVEDISEAVPTESKNCRPIESSELKNSKGSTSNYSCTSGKPHKESIAVIDVKPVACHTRSSISKPCNGLETPSVLLVNSSGKSAEQETLSGETLSSDHSKKVQNGGLDPTSDRPLNSSSDQVTTHSSGRNLRRNSVPVPAPSLHNKTCSSNSVSSVATNSSPPSRRTTRSLSSDCSSYSNNSKVYALNVARQSSVVPVVTISSSPTISVATTLSQSGTATVVSSSHSITKTRHHSTPQETISNCTDTQFSVDASKSVKAGLPLPDSGLSSREMVRLIQDHSNSFDSYCKRRGNRSSRRLCSTDTFLESEKQRSKLINLRKHGRSDCYFSESEDSCGAVEDVAVRNGRSTGHTKISPGTGTNGLGIHLIEKMATRNTSKSVTDSLSSNADTASHNTLGFSCTSNGNESLRHRLLNGSAAGRLSSKNKHRNHRSSLASDDSDCSSTVSKSNGLDRESDKVDINLLLEISVADRDKFEEKKSKLRKKNADWCLISETEKIIHEKEEILKNKNRPDSSTDDESEEDEEGEPLRSRRLESRIPSKIEVDHNSSEDSDSNFFVPERKKSCRKANKKYRTSDESFKLDSKHSSLSEKEIKNETSKSIEFTKDTNTSDLPADHNASKSTEGETIPTSRPKGRPKGSRNRRTLYDLTRLNEDTDDDNFFSFPVNSGLGQSPVTVACRDRRSSRSNTARLNGGDQHANNTAKKRLSDAERFLRDNREYYQFPETRERLRTSHERSDGEKVRPDEINTPNFADDDRLSGKEEISRKSKRGRPVSPCPENCKVSCNSVPLKTNVRRGKAGRLAGKRLRSKESEDELLEEELQTFQENSSEKSCEESILKKLDEKEDEANFSDGGSVSAVIPSCTEAVDKIVFSFEHVPKAEPWYQTYKRQVDGNKDHEYNKDEDYLRFVLPYEMPKEYFRDPLAKRNLANKKRADLAELARKSPRCHASTLALFSDILPCKKKQSKRAKSYCSAREEDQGTSDGTSTPGTDSNSRLPLTEHFETLDDFIAIEHCMNVLLRAALQRRELPSMEELKDDLSREAAGVIDSIPPKEENEVKPDPDFKRELRDCTRKDKRDAKEKIKEKDETSDDEELDSKKDLSRRKKRKRLCSSSSSTSNTNKAIKLDKHESKSKCASTQPIDFLKELKLENDPLASEVDPLFLVEMQDYITDKSQTSLCGTLDVSAAELCAHASSCKCTNVPQYHCYDDVSSVDGNTEASSECLSLVDSENLETSNFGKIHVKKRRKNLTGWPKIKKKRLTPTIPTSEDNDSALGFDDHISRKSKRTVRASQVSGTADDSERRASPRKKVAPLDAVPLRLRSAK
ncbi:Regulatory subunit Dfp1/Him1 central region [Trinorchestia longiramus]|nr:Regulatory subunit Dfp1/Him1 central region [Trinorchestia longiramus]